MARGDESIEARIAKAQRGRASFPGEPAIQGIVAQYIERQVGPLARQFAILGEKVEVLLGERGKDRSRVAVRRGDLAALNDIPKLESTAVNAPPTADDFNALRRDMERISQRLDRIAQVLNRG